MEFDENLFPFACRCEALCDNRQRGGRYKNLTGIYNASGESVFTVPKNWQGFEIFLVIVQDYVRPYYDITDKIVFDGENRIDFKKVIGELANLTQTSETSVYLLAKSPKSPDYVSIDSNFAIVNDEYRVSTFLATINFIENKMPEILGIEIYDEKGRLCGKKLLENIPENVGEDFEIDVEIPAENAPLYKVTDKIEAATYKFLFVTDEQTLLTKYTPAPEITENILDFEIINAQSGLVKVTNNSEYFCKKDLELWCKVFTPDQIVSKSRAILPAILPEKSTVVKLNFDAPDISALEHFVEFSVGLENIEIASQTKLLPIVLAEPEKFPASEMTPMEINETEDFIEFEGTEGNNFEYVFDKKLGTFTKIQKNGIEIAEENKGLFAQKLSSGVKILDKNDKFAVLLCDYAKFMAFIVVYADGEIGLTISGKNLIENSDENIAGKGKNFELNFAQNFAAYDSFSFDGEYRYLVMQQKGEDIGALIKGSPVFSAEIIDNHFALKIDENEPISVVLKPIFASDDNIYREARTLPQI